MAALKDAEDNLNRARPCHEAAGPQGFWSRHRVLITSGVKKSKEKELEIRELGAVEDRQRRAVVEKVCKDESGGCLAWSGAGI